jgi:hypothetical protein
MVIVESILKDLIQAREITSVVAALPAGCERWIVMFHTESGTHTVKSARGLPREFKELNAAARWLKDLGIERFEVDVT